MGIHIFLNFKNSGLIETVVSITVTICVFALRTSLTINSELFILFLSKNFKQTERGFSNFKLDRGFLRIPYGTLAYPLVTLLIFLQGRVKEQKVRGKWETWE